MHGHDEQPESARPTRVLMVDDHRTFTDLVCLALSAEPDLDCVATAHDSAAARQQVARCRPDIVLMDVDLGGEDGLELTAALLADWPDLLVVVLTAHGDPGVMRRAAAAGVVALLPKGGSLPELLSALRQARRGDLFVHPSLLRSLVEEQRSPGRPGLLVPDLTPRETAVLRLLTEGRQVTEIARRLGISVHTCRGYVKSLLAKLGAHSQLEAVVMAGRYGLLDASRSR